MYLFEFVFLVFSDIYPGVELLGSMVVLFSVLCKWVQPQWKTVRPDSGTPVSELPAQYSLKAEHIPRTSNWNVEDFS